MKISLLIVFLFISFVICSPVAINTPANIKIPSTRGPTTALKPREEDPPSLAPKGEITCNLLKKTYSQQALTVHIREGIKYLFAHGGSWTIKPYDTTRPSCSWDSAIYVINETEEEITIEFSRIGVIAQDITNACGSKNNRDKVNGEMRDPIGVLVIIGRALC